MRGLYKVHNSSYFKFKPVVSMYTCRETYCNRLASAV